jgi:hypothetical protein
MEGRIPVSVCVRTWVHYPMTCRHHHSLEPPGFFFDSAIVMGLWLNAYVRNEQAEPLMGLQSAGVQQSGQGG